MTLLFVDHYFNVKSVLKLFKYNRTLNAIKMHSIIHLYNNLKLYLR